MFTEAKMHRAMRGWAAALMTVAVAGPAAAQSTEELKRMALEQLLAIEVSIVSRQPQPASTVPAAVYVITYADIRRAGATSIPEALRLAPGVQVARIDAGKWAVGIRGFADRLTRSILVMIDGRTVYSPLFAGTYWEVQDTLLEDIDRIEVIRGPGGTLWGANAVNGIINIVTRRAADTQGPLVVVGGGSEEYGTGGARYGGRWKTGAFRVYGKAQSLGPEFSANAADTDHWRSVQGGFRAERPAGGDRTLTLQGDIYEGRLGEQATVTAFTAPYTQLNAITGKLSGGNVLARWGGQILSRDDMQLQAYYDYTGRDEIPVGERRNTIDLDFQHTFRGWSRQELSWGTGYRVSTGRITAVGQSAFAPPTRTDQLFSGFLQDEVAMLGARLRVAVGSKIEHNDYSGVEVQPSARVSWSLRPAQTLVASVTRAVRTPSRVETDYTTASFVQQQGTIPFFVRLEPNPSFQSERLVAYELGYRLQATSVVYATVSAFVNQYDSLLGTDLLTSFVETTPSVHVILPVTFRNSIAATSAGFEATLDVRPASWWRWTTNYSYLHVSAFRKPGSTDVSQEKRYEGSYPTHQVQVRSSMDLPHGWAADAFVRTVSALPGLSVTAYVEPTVRVAKQIGRGVELELVGQNLAHDRHLEWPSGLGVNTTIERSIYARLTWRR